MGDIEKQLDNISEIRELMEKSSRFISLSGLSGIFAGIFALIGAGLVYYKFSFFFSARYSHGGVFDYNLMLRGGNLKEFIIFSSVTGFIVLVLAISFGIFFTVRKANNKKQTIWDNTAKRLFINLFIPIITGGILIIALLYHNLVYLVAPVTLIFYGLGLVNASKYTLRDVRYLGICEIILGLMSAFLIGYGLIFWAIGFGFMHIVYGILMYVKYEKPQS